MTSAKALFSIALRPRKPEGSLGRRAQDGHLDSHTAPELWTVYIYIVSLDVTPNIPFRSDALCQRPVSCMCDVTQVLFGGGTEGETIPNATLFPHGAILR